MPGITIYLNNELFELLKRQGNVSRVTREALEKYLTERNMAHALLLNEKIKSKAMASSTEVIRKWREKRR